MRRYPPLSVSLSGTEASGCPAACWSPSQKLPVEERRARSYLGDGRTEDPGQSLTLFGWTPKPWVQGYMHDVADSLQASVTVPTPQDVLKVT